MRRRKGALAQSMTSWVEGLAASVQGAGQRAHSAAATGRAGSAGGSLTASVFSVKQEARSALRMRMECCLLHVLVLYQKCEAEALP